ncbi:MAG: glycosyltransferase family 9 protein [Bacteroidales bacterium]|nr:glycosyltransferase family 9 protein [Bacteroidales bacterium]MDD4711710.1 glycosyltransferase family 9 protein [Bacteroidales bacterium]
MAKILVIRLSALGDVAISVPLLQNLAEQYPEHQFIMISLPLMASLFEHCPSNVSFKAVETKGKHKGIPGLIRLFKEIDGKHIDAVCDLHDTLRSHFLGFLFKMHRIPVFRINKERCERRKLIRRKNKDFKQLKSSFERYRDVFSKAGLSLAYFNAHPKMGPSPEALKDFESEYEPKTNRWIGIAPFAKHRGKIYPLDRMEDVIARFAGDDQFKVFLFGGGKEELAMMKIWKEKYPSLQIPDKIGLSREIKLMSCLDIMLTMDSANMHLGSLAYTRVISIWGATHPYAGFYGLYQDERYMIQADLPCRPCSVFGNKPCYRNDYACMLAISSGQIIEKIEKELGI